MTDQHSVSEYDQLLAAASLELDVLRETLANLQAERGEMQGMFDVLAMLGTWDPTRLMSCLAAAATENRRPTTIDRELWTTAQAAEHCGVKPKTYDYYRKRLGAPNPVRREPGRGGQDLYDPSEVRTWQANRAGRGTRTDLRQE